MAGQEIDNQEAFQNAGSPLYEVFTKGVWGEHAVINNNFNGGPICASESTPEFKVKLILLFVSESFDYFDLILYRCVVASLLLHNRWWIVKTERNLKGERISIKSSE